jgi:TonB-linked SusC/RagA family outer membrane protein
MNMKYTFILWVCLTLLSSNVLGQGFTLKGRVQHKDGSAVNGASIAGINRSNRSNSDHDGFFLLHNSRVGDSIMFRCIGFRDTIHVVGNGDFLTMVMTEEMRALDVVEVSTGYQQIPKERATGSFEKIDNDALNSVVSTNILDRLEGNSSLMFDKDSGRPSVTLRGLSTIEGNTDLLIILDNFPYEGDLSNINPNDVQSISLLKDASAASIWGARASNGVIVITTKQGLQNQKPSIRFLSNTQAISKPDLYYYRQISSEDLIDVEQILFDKGAYTNAENSAQKTYLSPVVELLIAHREGDIDDRQLQTRLLDLGQIDSRDQYLEHLYRVGLHQQYNLSASGGTPKTKYHVSGGYDRNVNSLSARHSRLSFRANNDFEISSRLKLNTSLAYAELSDQSGYTGYTTNNTFFRPYINLLDNEGNEISHYQIRTAYAQDMQASGKFVDWARYPLREKEDDTRRQAAQNLLASMSINYRAFDGINLGVTYRYERDRNALTTLRGKESFFTRDLVNRFTTFAADNTPQQHIPWGDVYALRDNDALTHNVRGQIAYEKTIGDQQINFFGGLEIRSLKRTLTATGEYGYDGDRLLFQHVDYINPVRNPISGANQYIPYLGDYGSWQNNFISQFANAAYSFKNRYTINASARRDASNQFGLTTNEKWNPLWSTGLSWSIAEEPFFSSNWVSSLRLRTTYGVTGNMDPNKSAVPIIRYQTLDNFTQQIRAVIANPANPELRWERNKMWNVGLDFVTVGRRLSGSIEYYTKKSVDLFGPALNDITTGLGSRITKNIANMEGHGLESRLEGELAHHDFRWRYTILYNYNRNKVTRYLENINRTSATNISRGNDLLGIREGKPLYSIISYPLVGLDAEGDVISRLDGEDSKDYQRIINADKDNLVFSGSATPVHFGNVINHVMYKGLYIEVNLSFKAGHYYRRPGLYYANVLNMRALGHGTAEIADRWREPGGENFTNVPALKYPASLGDNIYSVSEVLVEKADNLRLQYVNLGYDIKRYRIKGQMIPIRVNFNMTNIGVLWRANKSGLDPDFPSSLPQPKTYALGINANF